METIQISIRNELEKILTKKAMKIYFGLVFIVPFLIFFITEKMIIHDMLTMPSINLAFSLLELVIEVLLPIFIFITTADLFTGELERGTLFPIRPIQRLELYISKISTLAFLLLVQIVLFFFGTTVNLVIYSKQISLSEFIILLSSTLLSWLPLIMIILLAALIAQLFHSSTMTVGVGLSVYLLMLAFPFIIPTSLYFFPTAYLDWYKIWNGNVSFQWIFQTTLYLFSFSTLSFTLGYYMFNKKEV